MPTEIELGVAEMFRDATQSAVFIDLRTDADWSRFNAIKDAADRHTDHAIKGYERERPERLAEARKAIIDRAGALTHDHPTPQGTDRFDKAAIDRQAHRKVKADHESHLRAIRQQEADSYVALRADIRAREGVRDHARDAFTHATDRRIDVARRGPSR